MSSATDTKGYGKLPADELKHICDSKGVEYTPTQGRKKSELVKLLLAHDALVPATATGVMSGPAKFNPEEVIEDTSKSVEQTFADNLATWEKNVALRRKSVITLDGGGKFYFSPVFERTADRKDFLREPVLVNGVPKMKDGKPVTTKIYAGVIFSALIPIKLADGKQEMVIELDNIFIGPRDGKWNVAIPKDGERGWDNLPEQFDALRVTARVPGYKQGDNNVYTNSMVSVPIRTFAPDIWNLFCNSEEYDKTETSAAEQEAAGAAA